MLSGCCCPESSVPRWPWMWISITSVWQPLLARLTDQRHFFRLLRWDHLGSNPFLRWRIVSLSTCALLRVSLYTTSLSVHHFVSCISVNHYKSFMRIKDLVIWAQSLYFRIVKTLHSYSRVLASPKYLSNNHVRHKRGLIHRDRESSVIRPLLYLQATTAGYGRKSLWLQSD